MLERIRKKYLVYLAMAFFVSTMFFLPYTHAASSISQGFKTDDPVATGALVSTRVDQPNFVELSTQHNTGQLVGVVGDNALLELTDDDENLKVVTSGLAYVFVSDINGEIKAGDSITTSPIAGIGMKAVEESRIVGTAQVDFSSVAQTRRTIVDQEGRDRLVLIAAIPIEVGVTLFTPKQSGSFVPAFLQNLANSVASGKQVSPVRVLIAALLLLLLFVCIAVLLYSATKSSIISIGRNPLSEKAVHKSLVEVGVTVAVILVFTVFLVYLILTV